MPVPMRFAGYPHEPVSVRSDNLHITKENRPCNYHQLPQGDFARRRFYSRRTQNNLARHKENRLHYYLHYLGQIRHTARHQKYLEFSQWPTSYR